MNTNNIDLILSRRVAEAIDKGSLKKKLSSGKKLRIKLGIDPNRPELHIGHAVPLMKLREFQNAGHQAVLIIGDWTALIGDPSGKDETRPQLTKKDVAGNVKKFKAQAYQILDKKKTEIRLQSEWYKKMGLEKIIELGSHVSVGQMLSHETFRKRLDLGQPFSFHELLYPLLQGYDSVAVKSDIELGALDQKFNVLMGRAMQHAYGQSPQDVILMPYLIGTDGREKMSKSLGNFIALSDSAEEMFGKVMRINDVMMEQYFYLCTEMPADEIGKVLKWPDKKRVKMLLAKEITKLYHGQKPAEAAEQNFESKFGKEKNLEIAVADKVLTADKVLLGHDGKKSLVEILVESKLASSKSEARRKILEGAIDINGERVADIAHRFKPEKNTLVRFGRKLLKFQ